MSTTPFCPKTFSFAGCRTDEQARARMDAILDELDAETVRSYAAQLFASEPDIAVDEFQDCLVQLRASLRAWRVEHQAEYDDLFQRMCEAVRRPRTPA